MNITISITELDNRLIVEGLNKVITELEANADVVKTSLNSEPELFGRYMSKIASAKTLHNQMRSIHLLENVAS